MGIAVLFLVYLFGFFLDWFGFGPRVGSLSRDGLGFRVGNGEGVGIACAGLGFGKSSLVGNFGNFVVLGNLF